MKNKIIFILLLLLLSPSLCFGDTHTAASCENKTGQLDVQTAVNAASAGDTVSIPAGTCTWDTKLNIAAAITITGQSNNSPTITAASNTVLFDIDLNDAAGEFQLTKMALVGAAATGAADVYLDGLWLKARINDITWSGTSPHAIIMGNNFGNDSNRFYGTKDITHQKVLIDNVSYTTSTPSTQFVQARGLRNISWLADDNYGTDDFLFIENCTLTWNLTSGQHGVVIDTDYGGQRYVARYNNITNGYFSQHDYANHRGNRLVEIYNNSMTANVSGQIAFNMTRGGTGIAHHNTITGYTGGLNNPMIYRVAYNNAGKFPGYYCNETGSLKTCHDAERHCVGGTKAGYPCYMDSQCTGGGTCNTSYTCTSSDECKDSLGNTLPCMQVDGDGTGGYPCRDQAGRGKDNATTGVQESDPIYWYSNTVDGTPDTPYSVGSYGAYITKDIDYCDHDPSTDCGTKSAWTYTIYTCPHPWAGTGSCNETTAGRDGYALGSGGTTGSGPVWTITGSGGAVGTLQ